MTAPLKPGERPSCDQFAWDAAKHGPIPIDEFRDRLVSSGATGAEIAAAVLLIGLVARDGLIGHPGDLPASGRRRGGAA